MDQEALAGYPDRQRTTAKTPRQKKRTKSTLDCYSWMSRCSHNCIYSSAIDIFQDHKFGYLYLSCVGRMSQKFDAAEGMGAYANLQFPRPELHSSARFPEKLRLNTQITVD